MSLLEELKNKRENTSLAVMVQHRKDAARIALETAEKNRKIYEQRCQAEARRLRAEILDVLRTEVDGNFGLTVEYLDGHQIAVAMIKRDDLRLLQIDVAYREYKFRGADDQPEELTQTLEVSVYSLSGYSGTSRIPSFKAFRVRSAEDFKIVLADRLAILL